MPPRPSSFRMRYPPSRPISSGRSGGARPTSSLVSHGAGGGAPGVLAPAVVSISRAAGRRFSSRRPNSASASPFGVCAASSRPAAGTGSAGRPPAAPPPCGGSTRSEADVLPAAEILPRRSRRARAVGASGRRGTKSSGSWLSLGAGRNLTHALTSHDVVVPPDESHGRIRPAKDGVGADQPRRQGQHGHTSQCFESGLEPIHRRADGDEKRTSASRSPHRMVS